MLFVEHYTVFTLGKSGDINNLLTNKEFLTENKQAGQSIENEINKLHNKTPGYEDIEFNDKIDFYNFLIERFYPNTSPMEVENLDPQLNKKIAKAIAKLMKRVEVV